MATEEDAEVRHPSVNQSLAVENESISNTAGSPTKVKVSASASNTGSSLFRSNKEPLKPVDLTSSAGARPDSSGNGPNANLMQKTTAVTKTSAHKETRCKLAATSTKRRAASDDDAQLSKKSKSSEAEVKCQTVHMPSPTTASVEHGGTEASPGMLNSLQTHADVSPECSREAPHSTSQGSVRQEQKNPANQPSCDSVSKPTKKAVVGE